MRTLIESGLYNSHFGYQTMYELGQNLFYIDRLLDIFSLPSREGYEFIIQCNLNKFLNITHYN